MAVIGNHNSPVLFHKVWEIIACPIVVDPRKSFEGIKAVFPEKVDKSEMLSAYLGKC